MDLEQSSQKDVTITPSIEANIDAATVAGFGEEWSRFQQTHVVPAELSNLFSKYFTIFPWNELPEAAEGFDAGCGSGRWAKHVAPRVMKLHAIDASEKAVQVAKYNLATFANCEVIQADVNRLPLADSSQDFGYSLGVLHHVPDTESALRSCVSKLKLGAPFLLYLYYDLSDRPSYYKLLWHLSDLIRQGISRLPFKLRAGVCDVIAASIYWPLARFASAIESLGMSVTHLPLTFYRNLSFYSMRTDALDRFGTRLEKRYSREQMESLMKASGLDQIEFSTQAPYWVAVGRRHF